MDIADRYLGPQQDPTISDRLDGESYLTVTLSDTERRRSRVRTETVDGRELGIVVGRELEGGDVLETESGDLVIVELATVEALVIDLSPTDSPTAALELGHAIGNRHWKLALRESEAVIPTTESRERMEALVGEWLPDATCRYEAVPPTLFGDGRESAGHDDNRRHDGDHSHAHSHSDPLSLGQSGGNDGDDR
ncbi:urease accessory protein UreE [Halorarius halobius]|uniref:urease accessory protein UreE n=1 Tax=Halorarius halobius TaxID=2962671 RepID=UPI0020CD9053|nr:urease accessory protein UreE [Halorarius halobius]